MLPAASRLRSTKDFAATVRAGVRVGRGTLVVHARPQPVVEQESQIGFVVSRKVGNAVTRNRVKRQLRHLAKEQLTGSPRGVQIVVRALPGAATRPELLRDDLAAAWQGCVRRLGAGSR